MVNTTSGYSSTEQMTIVFYFDLCIEHTPDLQK